MEYNNTVDTSKQGQSYLQLHPEMWQYFDQQQEPSSSSSQTNYKLLDGQDVVVSETIPSYPASAIMPGAVSSGNVYGYPLGVNIYDLSSQPEMTEEVKYPMYHNVRKHGNYRGNVLMGADGNMNSPIAGPIPQVVPASDAEVAVGMSNGNGDALGGDLNINLNRRQYPEGLSMGGNHHHSSHRQESNSPGSSMIESNGQLSDVYTGTGAQGPEDMWENYYRTATRDDIQRRDSGLGENGIIETKPKYMSNDPYEKRSGENPMSRLTNLLLDNNNNDDFRYGSPREFYRERNYPEKIKANHNSGIGDENENAILEEKRRLMAEKVHHKEEELHHHQPAQIQIPFTDSFNDNGNFETLHMSRSKRHIGPHDGGIQRLISTG